MKLAVTRHHLASSPTGMARKDSLAYFEIPFQGWLDGTWFEQFGPDDADGYLSVLEAAADTWNENDIVYGACFHDWTMIHYHEADGAGSAGSSNTPWIGARRSCPIRSTTRSRWSGPRAS